MARNAWASQTRSLTVHRYVSPKSHLGIWNDKVTRGDRRCQVTDRELARFHQRQEMLRLRQAISGF